MATDQKWLGLAICDCLCLTFMCASLPGKEVLAVQNIELQYSRHLFFFLFWKGHLKHAYKV